MLKAGKTNTTRLFCLIFEIFRGVIRKSGARFVATPLWGMEDAWVQSYIYIGLKLAAPFPPPLPMPSSLLGAVRTRARTRQGRRGGLNGLRPGATDAHTRSAQARRHYAVLCTAESMYIMRSMHRYLYIVMTSS